MKALQTFLALLVLFAAMWSTSSCKNRGGPAHLLEGESDAKLSPSAIFGSTEPPSVKFEIEGILTEVPISARWAFRAVGTDLAKEFMANLTPMRKTKVGVIDDGFRMEVLADASIGYESDFFRSIPESERTNSQVKYWQDGRWHGTFVAHLINGVGAHSISKDNNLVLYGLSSCSSTEQVLTMWGQAVDAVAAQKVDLINFSQGIPSKVFQSVRSRLEEMGRSVVFVQGAGNSSSRGRLVHKYNDAAFPIIQGAFAVGALTPFGLRATFSDVSTDGMMWAPGTVISVRGTGDTLSFLYGTSYTAPIVSGAVADAVAILGDIGPDDLKVIHEASGLPSLHRFERSSIRSSKIINHFRMVKYAQRLKANGWPEKKAELLKNHELLDFTEEAEKAFEKATSTSNETLKLELTRRAFFLSPDLKYSRSIEEIMSRHGYGVESLFFEAAVTEDPAGFLLKLLSSVKNEYLRILIIKESAFFANMLPLYQAALKDTQESLRRNTISLAETLPVEEAVLLLKTALTPDDGISVDDMLNAVRMAEKLGDAGRILLREAVSTPLPDVVKREISAVLGQR